MALLDLLLLVLAGLLAGSAAGLFGVGGGVIMVPVLHYLVGLPFVLSTQISLLAIAVNTPFGLWRQHARHRTVLWSVGWRLTLGGAVGVIVAYLLRPWVPVVALKVLFAVVGGFAAFRLVGRWRPRPHQVHGAWMIPVGVVGGMVAHWLGIGGGVLLVPFLVFMGTPIHFAVATALVPVFSNALVSTLIDLPVLVHHLWTAGALVVGAVVGIRLGVTAANRMEAAPLRRAFGIFLALMALYVLGDTLWPVVA